MLISGAGSLKLILGPPSLIVGLYMSITCYIYVCVYVYFPLVMKYILIAKNLED